MSARIHHGAAAPEALVVTITPGTSGLDMTTVTVVVFQVGETAVTWATTLSAVSTSSLKATHIFAADDVPVATSKSLMAKLTTPAGVMRAGPFTLTVT